jgi:hypothetical protein
MRISKAQSLRNLPELWWFSVRNKEPVTVPMTFPFRLFFDYSFKSFYFCIEQ